MQYPRLAARLYNTPHAIDPAKAEVLEAVFRAYVEGRAESLPEYKQSPHALFASGAARTAPEGHFVTSDGIAIIPVLGTLVQRGGMADAASGFTSYQEVGAQIAAAEADRGVRGIVLDMDSPGGEVAGMFDMAATIAASTKPVYAHANELAASAAYMLASASQKINVAQTGKVGSVGVVMLHMDQSAKDAKQGIKYTAIYAGDRKVDGNPHEPLSSEARSIAQAQVDSLYELFAGKTAEYRGIGVDAVKQTQGAALTAQDAVDVGFADGIATLAQTVDQLRAELLQPSMPVRNRAGAAAKTQEQPNMDQKEIDALVAKARTEGEATGAARATAEATAALTATVAAKDKEAKDAADASATASRERIAAILSNEESKGREALAQHLAFKTGQSVDDAVAMLKAAPKAEDKSGGRLGAAMPANPKVGADGDAEPDDAQATIARIGATAAQFAKPLKAVK